MSTLLPLIKSLAYNSSNKIESNKLGHACYVIHPSVSLQYFPVQFHKGEHGFDNQDMDMKPFFRAVGPAFHKNLEVGPFETVDIYALMCHILGIKPEVNDGHLNSTKHMLVSSTTTQGEFTSD